MKNLKKLILISLGLFCLTFNVSAQSYADYALTFSQLNRGGSARMQGVGGAQTALGGDVSSIYSNPAGLGFFNKSEFSFSPSLNYASTSSDYLGINTQTYKTNLNFGNLGIVFNNSKGSRGSGGWRGGSFGVSLSRINDFQNKFSYEGKSTDSQYDDLVQSIVYDMQDGYETDLTDMAFNTYVIDEFYNLNPNNSQDTSWYYDTYIEAISESVPLIQTEDVETSGAQYQWSLSYGGNYADKVYFGAGLGISSIRYSMDRVFREARPGSTVINDIVLTDNFRVNGTGINATAGVIIRPVDIFTVGVSVTTPTFYRLNEDYTTYLDASFRNFEANDGTRLNNESDYVSGAFEYSLRTPLRLNGGLALFFNKNGFISADVEYLDYTQNNLQGDGFSLSDDNNRIAREAQSALNYRVGGEYRFDMFRVRAGYNFVADPYKNTDGIDRSRTSFSGGVGIRFKNYFIDLAVVNTSFDSAYRPYFDADNVYTKNSRTSGILTLGFTF